MAGYIGSTPVPQGIQEQQSFTATAGQTTFNTLGYTDGNTIRVTLNGVLLEGGGVDYTATNGSDIVLTAAAIANDILTFETFNEFQLVSQTITTPTISGGTLKSNVTLKNDTEQDTDGGRASKIIYQGEQSGGEISTLAEIQASHDGTADDEKADLIFRVNDGNDGTSPTERARIQSDGILLVGKTASDGAVAGHEIRPASFAIHTRESGPALYARRIGSGASDDGDILALQNANGDVGSIGSYSDDMTIGTGDTRIRFIDSLDCIVPVSDASGTSRDANVDLGYSSIRFKDIYTSGGIYLGAASAGSPVAANYLDDYEEGSWTGSLTTGTATIENEWYVKIGAFVIVSAKLSSFSDTSSGNAVIVGGLPFTSTATNHTAQGSMIAASVNAQYYPYLSTNASQVYFYQQNSGSYYQALNHNALGTGASFYFTIAYQSTA